jgi:hypothetical protein
MHYDQVYTVDSLCMKIFVLKEFESQAIPHSFWSVHLTMVNRLDSVVLVITMTKLLDSLCFSLLSYKKNDQHGIHIVVVAYRLKYKKTPFQQNSVNNTNYNG